MGLNDELRRVAEANNYFNQSRGEVIAPPIKVVPVEESIDPELTEYERFTSLDNIDDVDRLVELIRMLLERAWGDECPLIVDEYPTNMDSVHVKLPMVIYDYYDRLHSDKTKKAPNIMQRFTHQGETYELLSEWYDCKVEFQILAASTREAKVMAKKFEVFLRTYIPYFKHVGVADMTFEIEPKSEPLQIANQSYNRRTLVYRVKLERRYIRREGEAMQTIQVVLGIQNTNHPPGIPGVNTQYDSQKLPEDHIRYGDLGHHKLEND